MPDVTFTGNDALVLAQTLNTISAVITNSVARGIAASKVDPLSPTPFTGSATNAIENALANMSTLSFTDAEVNAVTLAIQHATDYENHVQQATGRVIQIIDVIKPLITKLIPLIV